ncbi:Aflatoxin biosynthesis regulatory protein [Candida viswanathii]|uniref:Aflatoxin biosynthesis regulatory protein n=1 Tax=Candida viswanathii TaxID=5486 RepID=A0A367XRH2_9ASCO|nr:Aflatoxin biosynthesis regulatory protein [Candida viswanathii]
MYSNIPPPSIPVSPLFEFYHLQPLSDSSPISLASRLSPVSANPHRHHQALTYGSDVDIFNRAVGYSSVSALSFDRSDPTTTTETSPYSDFGDFFAEEKLLVPRKKLNRPRVKKQSVARSRRACLGCRAKKLKCDESKPSCSRCIEKGLSCNYTLQLQFREDVEAKGKRFGREGINSSGSDKLTTDLLVQKSKDSHYQLIKNAHDLKFVNFFVHDVNDHEPKYHLCHSLNSSIIPHDVIYGSGVKDATSLGYALNYYIHFISPILSPVGNNSITYDHIPNASDATIVIEKGLDLSSLMKYSQKNNAIFFLMLSLGSMYLSKLNGVAERAGWLSKAKHFQDLGLGKIQPEIERLISGSNTETPFDTDLLVCLVLLILYEFANDCDRKWTVYLKLCKKLITSKNFKIPKESLEYSLLKFCLEFLDYQESMGRTACKDVNLFFLELDDQDENLSLAKNQVNLVSWMGCDRRLIPIISDITDLSFERFRNSVTETDYLALSEDMLRRLHEMKISMMDQITLEKSMEPEEICFLIACEVKRLSTELYLQSCLMCLTPEDDTIHDLVHEIFKNLEYIVITNDLPWSSLIWPVFMACSQISCIDPKCEELRYLGLSILDRLDLNSLGNIGKTRKIVINIWKKRDMNNSDLQSVGVINKASRKFKRRKRLMGFVNDWEKFVVEEDYAIALA